MASLIVGDQIGRRLSAGVFGNDPAEMMGALTSGKLFLDENDGSGKNFPHITLDLDPKVMIAPIVDSVKALGFKPFSFASQFEEIKKFFFYFDLALAVVGIIALVTASLGIINTMVMSVLERRREIGVLKSLGADDKDIRYLFLTESAVIGLAGSLFGILLGWVITLIASKVAHIFMEREGIPQVDLFALPLWLIGAAIVLGLIVSLLAGYYPLHGPPASTLLKLSATNSRPTLLRSSLHFHIFGGQAVYQSFLTSRESQHYASIGISTSDYRYCTTCQCGYPICRSRRLRFCHSRRSASRRHDPKLASGFHHYHRRQQLRLQRHRFQHRPVLLPLYRQYQGFYGPGSATNRFFPALGNHDYSDGGGFGSYLSYFTLPGTNIPTTGTSGNPRYYDFIRGPVHFFVINSNFQEPDGTTPNSAQGIWLQTQLAASPLPWKIVYMHHPPYSSSQHGSTPGMQWPFEAWGASIVMTGHDHTYERIKRDDNNDSDSLTYIVTGLGGRSIYTFPSSNLVTGSVIRYNANYGANLIEATDSTLSVRFISIAGVTIDSFLLTRPPICCTGTTGNLNGLGDVDLLDLSAMISFLLHDDYQFACTGEANLDKHGGIDLTDLSYLISYLQGVLTSLPTCP